MNSRTSIALATCALSFSFFASSDASADETPVRFVRYRHDEKVSFGIVEGDKVRAIDGSIFKKWKKTDRVLPLSEVRVLVPTRPTKVLALAGNYRDHLGDREPPAIPQPFIKLPSCLQRHEGRILLPEHTHNVHYEAEVVVIIGKRAKDVSEKKALDYVLGITCGNDVSARIWQNGAGEEKCEKCGNASDKDIQWWRAKASDTFGPCGPYILSAGRYDNLEMTLRVNGEVRQKTNTKNMIHDIAQVVSFISRHCTLEPGDMIFTGTPGKTKPLSPGDVVEVEIEGVGVLRNKVARKKSK